VARGLGPGGRLLCCDISQEWTSIARAAWQEAGVANRIDLRVGPGLETLRALPPGEQFDFAFIDADKTGYAQYYEEVLTRLRPGGLILLDNTLQGGHVAGDLPHDEDVAAIRSLNDAIAGDPRLKVVLIPIGDGVSFVQNLVNGLKPPPIAMRGAAGTGPSMPQKRCPAGQETALPAILAAPVALYDLEQPECHSVGTSVTLRYCLI
jgi:SAM-dependent methyltransferase